MEGTGVNGVVIVCFLFEQQGVIGEELLGDGDDAGDGLKQLDFGILYILSSRRS